MATWLMETKTTPLITSIIVNIRIAASTPRPLTTQSSERTVLRVLLTLSNPWRGPRVSNITLHSPPHPKSSPAKFMALEKAYRHSRES